MSRHEDLVPVLARELSRRTLLTALRANPTWTLADLATICDANRQVRDLMSKLTVAHLVTDLPPPPDPKLRRRAEHAEGAAFDLLVHEVLLEMWPCMVRASDLRQRVGGPRWKLQHSLIRLVAKRLVVLTGNTSNRCYCAHLGGP